MQETSFRLWLIVILLLLRGCAGAAEPGPAVDASPRTGQAESARGKTFRVVELEEGESNYDWRSNR